MRVLRWFTCDNSCPGDHSEEFNIWGPHPPSSNKPPPPLWPQLAVTKPYWQVIRDNLISMWSKGIKGEGGGVQVPAHKCPHLNSDKNLPRPQITMAIARTNNKINQCPGLRILIFTKIRNILAIVKMHNKQIDTLENLKVRRFTEVEWMLCAYIP